MYLQTRIVPVVLLGFSLLFVGSVLQSKYRAQAGGSDDGATVTPTHVITSKDKVPRPCAESMETQHSVKNGSWSDPSTWSSGTVPSPVSKVGIAHTVTLDAPNAETDCIEVRANGTLTFASTSTTQLLVTTLMILPRGTLTIGTANTPVTGRVEILFRDTPLLVNSIDPAQLLNGLVVFGKAEMYGKPMDSTFMRVAQEPHAGDTTLILLQPVASWKVGDTLFLPDSRQVDPKTSSARNEEMEIAAVNGNVITLKNTLQFDHPGARDIDGKATILPDGTPLLPHVGNITRSIVLRSQNPNGVRAHTFFTARASADIRYALFQDLGRTTTGRMDSTTFDSSGNATHIGTNQIGRYALHLHHNFGPVNPLQMGYQFQLIGNAVVNSQRWGLVTHMAHFGLIKDNVVYKSGGAAFTGAEDGPETANEFVHNFAAAAGNKNLPRDRDQQGLPIGNTSCYWFGGTPGKKGSFVGNVAAQCAGEGFNLFVPSATAPILRPKFPGADPTQSSTQESSLVITDLGKFKEFETYGSQKGGLELWNLQPAAFSFVKPYFEDVRIWHASFQYIFENYAGPVTFTNLVLRGDPAQIRTMDTTGLFTHNPIGTQYDGYFFDKPDIQGLTTGMQYEGMLNTTSVVFTDAVFGNGTNIDIVPDSFRREPHLLFQFNRPLFRPVPGQSAEHNIVLAPFSHNHDKLVGDFIVRVTDYNRKSGDTFRIYHQSQLPDALLQKSTADTVQQQKLGCPWEQMTNAQCYEKYGFATGGSTAPCTQQKYGIEGGVTCTEPQNPPSTNAPLKIYAMLNKDSDDAGSVAVMWQVPKQAAAGASIATLRGFIDSMPSRELAYSSQPGLLLGQNRFFVADGTHTITLFLSTTYDDSGMLPQTKVTMKFQKQGRTITTLDDGHDGGTSSSSSSSSKSSAASSSSSTRSSVSSRSSSSRASSSSARSQNHIPLCADHRDNDGDGKIDAWDEACHNDGDVGNVNDTYNPYLDDERMPASLTIEQSAPKTAERGKQFTIVLTIKNKGERTATEIAIEDTLPADIDIGNVTSRGSGCVWEGRAITCSADELRPGDMITVNIVAVSQKIASCQPVPISNDAYVISSESAATAETLHVTLTCESGVCEDGKDNDGDGLADMQDFGCKDAKDNDEMDTTLVVGRMIMDDGDNGYFERGIGWAPGDASYLKDSRRSVATTKTVFAVWVTRLAERNLTCRVSASWPVIKKGWLTYYNIAVGQNRTKVTKDQRKKAKANDTIDGVPFELLSEKSFDVAKGQNITVTMRGYASLRQWFAADAILFTCKAR